MQLKLIQEALQRVAGKPATGIADILYGKKDVNELLISKKLKLTINQTRNILYKLLEAGMVFFMRKKDRIKAWYTYFWTLDPVKSLEILAKIIRGEIEHLRRQLSLRKTRRFYLCKNCGIEVNEETALINDFTCTECGSVYELHEDKKILQELESGIRMLEKSLHEIEEEIEKLRAMPLERRTKVKKRGVKTSQKKHKKRKEKRKKRKEK